MISPKQCLPFWLAASALALTGCGSGGEDASSAALAKKGGSAASEPMQVYATKVTDCASGDHPESALQGQVPAAMRTSANPFKGFNCNLELIGQQRGVGGNWSSARFKSAGRTCAYHSTAMPNPNRPKGTEGAQVIDITDPTHPLRTMSLSTSGMLDSWEGLRANQRRKLLYSANAANGGGNGDFDVYDLSGDCGSPQWMSTTALTFLKDGATPTQAAAKGHEGSISPDGLTYYIGDLANRRYYAVDVTNPARPKLIATFNMDNSPIGKTPHGLSISKDGNRAYVVAVGIPSPEQVADPTYAQNGFLVLDTSEVQARKPNAQMKVISATAFRDGSLAQHTITTKIRGKPYLVMVDEAGSGGISGDATVPSKLACAQGMSPFPMARIYDMSDEKHPQPVSKLGLETHDPNNCDAVLPDIAGLGIFTYGSHYCSVDNLENATTLACSYFNSGIRVFDIREPAHPKEIAYFNPPSQLDKTAVPGSNHVGFGQWRQGGPDWCASRLDFDHQNGTLTTMCQDNGLLVMKFKKGVWPFDNSAEAAEDED
ncbi:LVIVD repeat-containing protein [Noviherbaspirillum pedocola]|uniref:Lipoprotein n=1 Tax=Noviherbaspirillum pedocola TaxID=2801341 RepID=A0A934STU7_9BURK|nr:hypothetical protein [Noviherbaspirillum pedocola]MBK4736666.1 hypothetical protein [Noviherbaspirillum pedocola]